MKLLLDTHALIWAVQARQEEMALVSRDGLVSQYDIEVIW